MVASIDIAGIFLPHFRCYMCCNSSTRTEDKFSFLTESYILDLLVSVLVK